MGSHSAALAMTREMGLVGASAAHAHNAGLADSGQGLLLRAGEAVEGLHKVIASGDLGRVDDDAEPIEVVRHSSRLDLGDRAGDRSVEGNRHPSLRVRDLLTSPHLVPDLDEALDGRSEVLVDRDDDLLHGAEPLDRKIVRPLLQLGRMGSAPESLGCHGKRSLLFR
jgi:hypothetical protein